MEGIFNSQLLNLKALTWEQATPRITSFQKAMAKFKIPPVWLQISLKYI